MNFESLGYRSEGRLHHSASEVQLLFTILLVHWRPPMPRKKKTAKDMTTEGLAK